jgi:hypothetical protein
MRLNNPFYSFKVYLNKFLLSMTSRPVESKVNFKETLYKSKEFLFLFFSIEFHGLSIFLKISFSSNRIYIRI